MPTTVVWRLVINNWKKILGILSKPSLQLDQFINVQSLQKEIKFATLELPYGIEGVAAIKNLAKEDGTLAEVGESLDFTVLEFLKDEKKIVLTHSKVKAAPASEEKKEDKPAKAASAPAKSSSAPETASKEGEKSTFGDLSVLSALKEQMEESEKKGKK